MTTPLFFGGHFKLRSVGTNRNSALFICPKDLRACGLPLFDNKNVRMVVAVAGSDGNNRVSCAGRFYKGAELRGAEKCRNVMIAEEYISVRRVIARSAALTNGRENSAFAVAILFKTH